MTPLTATSGHARRNRLYTISDSAPARLSQRSRQMLLIIRDATVTADAR
jgi:hypothetical protein